MKLLEELYYGNIRPVITDHSNDSEYANLIRLREINRENLLEHLNEQEKNTFDKFDAAQSEAGDIAQYQKFAHGFRLGMLLMAEACTGGNELINREI